MIGLVQIRNTSEAVDPKGVYTVFNVYVNGCYHGAFRYSQLLALHQELKAKYNISALEEFPGKHWFSSLSHEQLLARRIGLERYLHSVCQDRTIGTSDMLKEFFIAMQRASGAVSGLPGLEEGLQGRVEVFLVNGKSVSVEVGQCDRTDQVLERVCSEIQLPSQLTYYFGLYMEKQEEGEETWTVCRPLTDFECPYISLQVINQNSTHRIVIRKSFWDPQFLPELCEDRVAKNLLYIEALAAVAANHWDMTPDVRKQLSTHQRKAQKKQYIELVGTLHQYGFLQLDNITIDHPDDETTGIIRVGKMEMTSYTREDNDTLNKIFTYSLTRIKSWKLGGKPGSPWLKFFYQVGAGDFTPVSVVGPQTVILSHSLHSIVDELLRVRGKQEIRQPQLNPIMRERRTLPSLVIYERPTPPEPEEPAETTPTGESDSETTPTSAVDEAEDTPTVTTTTTSNTTPSRLTSVGSVGEPEPSKSASVRPKETKIKTPKKKQMPSLSDVENPTFSFGTDDDL